MSKIMAVEHRLVNNAQDIRYRSRENKNARESLKAHPSMIAITREEKKLIEKTWGGLGLKIYTDWHCLYKNVNQFASEYVPTDLFYLRIIPKLNSRSFWAAWNEKTIYSRLFPNVSMPRTIGYRINGLFYDDKYKEISCDDFERILREEKRVIVKPSDGYEGRGVEIWDTHDVDLKTKLIHKARSYVVQEVLMQHESLSKLNESSVNPIRVMTLRLNGKIKYLHSIVRFGIPGSITDVNFKNGKEIIQACSVSSEGIINPYYYDANGLKWQREETMGGNQVLQIPNFDKVIQLALEIHEGLYHFDLVGSDITVDRNGNPIMIEFNIGSPGPIFPQYCNGPLFGDYTEELIFSLGRG